MKKKTKIVLIASGAIVLLGIILCIVGSAIASSGGEQLFPVKTEAGSCYTYTFKSNDIGRVSFNAQKAKVNIIGSADESFIEIIDFDENLSTFTNSNAMVTFRESADFSSALRFWEGGFSFKGLRYFLRSGKNPDGGTINVYLSDDVKVKVFDIELVSGKISISDIDNLADYNITLGTGSVSLKNITSASAVNITATDATQCPIALDNVSSSTLCVKAPIADVKASSLSAENCDITVKTGSFNGDFSPLGTELFTADIISGGKLMADGTLYIDSFSYAPDIKDNGRDEDEIVPYIKISGTDLSVKLDTPLPDENENENENVGKR